MTTGQHNYLYEQDVPPGYYISNSKNEDCFYVSGNGNFFFKKAMGKKWAKTDKWNFDHVCTVTTVDEEQGVSADVDTHDGRGLEVKVSAHVGVTVSEVMKWQYVSPDGNQAKVWAGAGGGPGAGAGVDAGVWYDKDGDLHLKLSTSGVIPHVDFGAAVVINPKTVENLDKPTPEDTAFAEGVTEGATLDIAKKPPKVLVQTVATVHKVADTVAGWFK